MANNISTIVLSSNFIPITRHRTPRTRHSFFSTSPDHNPDLTTILIRHYGPCRAVPCRFVSSTLPSLMPLGRSMTTHKKVGFNLPAEPTPHAPKGPKAWLGPGTDQQEEAARLEMEEMAHTFATMSMDDYRNFLSRKGYGRSESEAKVAKWAGQSYHDRYYAALSNLQQRTAHRTALAVEKEVVRESTVNNNNLVNTRVTTAGDTVTTTVEGGNKTVQGDSVKVRGDNVRVDGDLTSSTSTTNTTYHYYFSVVQWFRWDDKNHSDASGRETRGLVFRSSIARALEFLRTKTTMKQWLVSLLLAATVLMLWNSLPVWAARKLVLYILTFVASVTAQYTASLRSSLSTLTTMYHREVFPTTTRPGFHVPLRDYSSTLLLANPELDFASPEAVASAMQLISELLGTGATGEDTQEDLLIRHDPGDKLRTALEQVGSGLGGLSALQTSSALLDHFRHARVALVTALNRAALDINRVQALKMMCLRLVFPTEADSVDMLFSPDSGNDQRQRALEMLNGSDTRVSSRDAIAAWLKPMPWGSAGLQCWRQAGIVVWPSAARPTVHSGKSPELLLPVLLWQKQMEAVAKMKITLDWSTSAVEECIRVLGDLKQATKPLSKPAIVAAGKLGELKKDVEKSIRKATGDKLGQTVADLRRSRTAHEMMTMVRDVVVRK